MNAYFSVGIKDAVLGEECSDLFEDGPFRFPRKKVGGVRPA